MASTQTTNNFISADGLNLFYREAAPKNLPNAPIILLLHGFPSSSHQYRNLIPLLSQKYRVLAPDLPGFGFTEVPPSRNYTYAFSSLTTTILAFVDALQIKKFAIYVFDYGAPTGLRLALERPEAITAIITQNGNAYTEGLSSSFWNPIKEFWTTQNTQSDREALGKEIFALETTKWQYVNGEPSSHLKNIAPESYHLDYFLLNQPGNIDVQLSLFYDYQNNVKLYPDFQRYFRESGVPILAVWGKNDDIFVKAGAEAFKRDGKEAEVVLLDAGHFAVESHVEEVADAIVGFLGKRGI